MTGATPRDFLPLYWTCRSQLRNRIHLQTSTRHARQYVLFLGRYGDETHLIVLFDTALVATAIATSVGVIVVAALITITMALCFIRAQRDQPQSKRVSVITPVIDICRPAHSNVDRDSRIVAPQRPREALLSCKTATSCSSESLPIP